MRRRTILGATAGILMFDSRLSRAATVSRKRLVIVSPATPVEEIRASSNTYYQALFQELGRSGFVEPETLLIEPYSGEGETGKYGALADRVVKAAPDVILCVAGILAAELKARTKTIPIVAIVADPVASGLVSSLARPDANLTGVTVDAGMDLYGKRIALLRQLLPALSRLGYVSSSRNWQRAAGETIRNAAVTMGVEVRHVDIGDSYSDSAYASAFGSLGQLQALLVSDEPEHLRNHETLLRLANASKLPTMYPFRELTSFGGLMSYSVDLVQVYRLAGKEVVQIFRGEKPSNIPFVQPTGFQLSINLRTARMLDIKMPPFLIAQADQVIE